MLRQNIYITFYPNYFRSSTSKSTIADFCSIIIYRDSVLYKDSLHESCICRDCKSFVFIGIICDL